MDEFSHAESIVIAASPEVVYDLVSDVTRTGEWSPIVQACWWDEGSSAQVGHGFTGRNVLPERTWETHCEVVAAEPGAAFGWVVGDALVWWMYTMNAVAGGTELTEAWRFLPGGIALMHERYPDSAQAEIAARIERAHHGISATLAAMKRIAETT
ncbi:MAG: SRPBCC family protein [Sporichthyaceae bacterium]